MTINVCNKASQIKTTALFNIHYFRSILLLAFSVSWASPLLSGLLGFINTSPENTSHYWTTNCQRTGRSCSVIDLMHPPTHTYTHIGAHVHTHTKKKNPMKKQGLLFHKNTTIFSRFPPSEKEQHANLQSASLWSIKGCWRWIIYGRFTVVWNHVKSSKQHALQRQGRGAYCMSCCIYNNLHLWF